MRIRNGQVRDDLTKVKPGDELVLRNSVLQSSRYAQLKEPKRVTVAKVGRTLIHVWVDPERPESGTEAYRIETGRANTDRSVGSGPPFVQTVKFYEWQRERRDLVQQLARLGVDVEPNIDRVWYADRLSTEQLRALLAVMTDVESEWGQ